MTDVSSAGGAPARRHAVILAGGSGTRLWPLSRQMMPKQLLRLNGTDSLLQQTARRLGPRVDAGRIFTVTHNDHRFEVVGQLHAVHPSLADGVLCEPTGRNTLPAIAWAVARIAATTPDALIGVFSSDHAVTDQASFETAWEAAEAAADAGYLALFGMKPTEPATGYGYIKAAGKLPGVTARCPVLGVERFVEKPDIERAREFLRQGDFFWNGGMFVFRADVFLAQLKEHQPALTALLSQLRETSVPAKELYMQLPDTSIDYGLLEHADRVAVVPVNMGWSDLGSWDALYQLRESDTDRNVVHGDVLAVETHGNLLWSESGLIAAYGTENLAIIQTRDATLVCPRDRAADLKPLVARLKAERPALTETHVTVARPWGSYTVLEEGPEYKIKRIEVKPGQKLSMQMHHHRSEHWVVVAGTAKIVNGEQEIYLEENQSTYIPKTCKHRLENPGKIPLQIIEIQTGSYLEEDDIVRFGDVYGRA